MFLASDVAQVLGGGVMAKTHTNVKSPQKCVPHVIIHGAEQIIFKIVFIISFIVFYSNSSE